MKAIILGNSFSLKNFSLPVDFIDTKVYAVNRIFLSVKWKDKIDYYCALDPYLWKTNLKEIQDLKCRKYYIHEAYYNKIDRNLKDKLDYNFRDKLIPLKINSVTKFGNKAVGYGHGFSSIYPCLQLAIEEGAKVIELRGIDFGKDKGNSHFFGNRKLRLSLETSQDIVIKALNELKSKGISIIVYSKIKWWDDK